LPNMPTIDSAFIELDCVRILITKSEIAA
jgi:hypothetical protein